MDWDAVGALGEVMGALAVFGSLLYLAIQIKMFSNASKAQNEQQIVRDLISANDSINGDIEGRETLLRGLYEGLESLNEAELFDFSTKISSMVNLYYAAQESGRRGLLADDVPNGILNSVLLYLKTPGGRQWWEKSSWLYTGQGDEISLALESSDIPSLQEWMRSMRADTDK